jgi:membrane protein required for colicin V production
MGLLDLILATIVGSSVVAGFMAGLARAGIGFITAIVAVLFGFWFYSIPAALLASWLGTGTSGEGILFNAAGFVVVAGITMALGGLVGRMVSKFFQWTGLGWLDRMAGAGFGFVRGALVAIAFVAVLLAFAPTPTPNWMAGSRLLPYAVQGSAVVSNLAPPVLKDGFFTGLAEIQEVWAAEVERARERTRGMRDAIPDLAQ